MKERPAIGLFKGVKEIVELTTLVIPTKNDDPEEMEREAEWIASISPDIPLHLSRFPAI